MKGDDVDHAALKRFLGDVSKIPGGKGGIMLLGKGEEGGYIWHTQAMDS